MRHLLVLLPLVLVAAAPPAASAGTYFGAPAVSSVMQDACLNGDSRCTTFFVELGGSPLTAPATGVITRVLVVADGVYRLRLRTGRAAGGASYRAVASSSEFTTLASTSIPTTVAVRVPIAAGDVIGLDRPSSAKLFNTRSGSRHADLGGSGEAADGETRGAVGSAAGSEPALTVDIEPDADGDGYGDDTQDQCPADPTRAAGACSGTLLGPSLSGLIRGYNGSCPSGTCFSRSAMLPSAATRLAVADGIVVRWRVGEPGADETQALDVLRRQGSSSTYDIRSSTPSTQPYPGALKHLMTIPSRIPVKAGDELALRLTGTNVPYAAALPGGEWENNDAGAPSGSSVTLGGGVLSGAVAMVNADVEADADRDGFGDETQDGCPTDPATQAPCSADLAITASGPSTIEPGAVGDVTFRLTNLGTTRATNAQITLPPTEGITGRGLTAPADARCFAMGSAQACAFATLDPGERREVAVRVSPNRSGPFTVTAAVGSDTTDPVSGNNTAAFAFLAPASIGPDSLPPDRTGPMVTIGTEPVRLDRRGRAAITVSCPRGETAGCRSVRVQLFTRRGRRLASIGRSSTVARVAAGRSATLRVRLTRTAVARVARARRLRVTVSAIALDALGNSAVVSGGVVIWRRR